MDTDDIKILATLLCKNEKLFIDFLRKVCTDQDIQEKKKSDPLTHPTDENT